MAVLKVLKGSCPGQLVELHGERMVMGRHPNCHIVLDNAAVSRNHAQILESHGSYFLEDLRSRNGTLLNGEKIRGRTPLNDGDEIKVCDVLMSFHLGAVPAETPVPIQDVPPRPTDELAAQRATVAADVFLESTSKLLAEMKIVEGPPSDNSSIITTLDVAAGKHPRISVRPEAKLRAVVEIGSNLAKTLELDLILPKILESLFKIFPQADRGFVVLKDFQTGQLVVKAMRTRTEEQAQAARLSMTILKEAITHARAILSADASDDARFDTSESVANMRIRSLMCAPMVGHAGDALGVIHIDTLDIRQQFSQDDLDVLASVTAQAALAVENAHLYASVIKQRDLDRELEFATQVQLGFLPTERPRLPGYEFFDFYEAAYRVGGDFFDYVKLPDGRVAIGLGDVAGKGVPAALLMARLYSAARYELLTKPTPSAAMAGLNIDIASGGLGHRFVTLVFVILNPVTNTATIVNAGHLPPLLRNAQGRLLKIGVDESGLPLGIKPDTEYQQAEITLEPGDSLILFTDGVTESMDPRNEIYGMKRLLSFLEGAPAASEALGEALVEDVERFGEGRAQRDDICIICLRRLPDRNDI